MKKKTTTKKPKRTLTLVSKSDKRHVVKIELDAELLDRVEANATAHNFTLSEFITLCLSASLAFVE